MYTRKVETEDLLHKTMTYQLNRPRQKHKKLWKVNKQNRSTLCHLT